MNNISIKAGENDIKAADLPALNKLLKQLNPEAPTLILKKVKEVMKLGTIITLRDTTKKDVLIGMGTLVLIKTLVSYHGSIEDVVVEASYRSQGLGKEIMKRLIQKGRAMKIKFIDLTSKPERIAANGLYKSIGFEKRNTNLYRLYH